MYNTLGDTLAVKVGKKVDEVEILEKKRSILAYTLNFILSTCVSNSFFILRIA